MTTKAEPIIGKFKNLGGFCVSSFWTLCEKNMSKILCVPILLREDYIFRFIHELWSNKDEYSLSIDFSKVEFAYPFGALILTSTIRDFVRYRNSKSYQTFASNIDSSNQVHSYLEHIGFFKYQLLDRGNEPGKAIGNIRYIPITPITRRRLVRNVASNNIGSAVQDESERLSQVLLQISSPTVLHPVTYCFREIIRNVFEHAATHTCLICAQKWDNQEIEIAILDRGRGIKESLEEKYSFNNDYEALAYALKPGVSRVDETQIPENDEWANSGFGLYVLSRLSRENGEFLISSGQYALRQKGNLVERKNYHFDGTAVKMKIKKPKGVDISQYIRKIVKEGEEQASTYTAKRKSASKSIKKI